MMKPLRKTSTLIKIINNSLIDFPSPSNFSTMWNFGSLLGFMLMMQIITGILLSTHYCANIDYAFHSIIHICRDVNYGWLIRTLHSNGASFFFIFLYIHIGRGIYYNSFMLIDTWMIGVTIFILTMATAFLGYVLPWGQMSFWGATVITNMMSAIPYLGPLIVQWLWGGFAISNPTLTRFFTFHFILPFIILALVVIHLMFLHKTGSNNPLGSDSNIDKIPFHPFYTLKDLVGIIITIFMLLLLNLSNPYMLSDPDNFTPANPLVTPIHIQPEWYFLFAYAILRSIPNKLGGVLALLMSVMIFYILPFINMKKIKSNQFYPLSKIMFWIFISTFILLSWIGSRPVEDPYILIGQILTISYFSYFFINYFMIKIWEYLIF